MAEPEMKKRRPNFGEEELVVMVREVEKRKTIIEGSFTSGITKQGKLNAWDCVTATVNAVGGNRRTRDAVRKKYFDYRSDVKRKASLFNREHRATGKKSLVFIYRNII